MNRYYAYVRVSTVRQGEHGVSLQEQRAAIERYAAQHDLTIEKCFEERETAAHTGRAIFAGLIRELRAGKVDGVILHKIDRGARNLRDWADIADLADMGVDVRFTTESYDFKSRGGRLAADIQAVVAADYIRNLREETLKGITGRLRQGLYPNKAPIGYLDRGPGKRKELDATRAPLIKLAFELYATGLHSLASLVDELQRRGLRNRRGGIVRKTALSWVLNNPFYVGVMLVRRTGESFDGVHEPLIPKKLFDDVQNLLRLQMRRGPTRTTFRYTRLVKCRECGYNVTGELQKGHVYYRCRSGRCNRVCIREESIDVAVMAAVGPIALGDGEAKEVLDAATALLRRESDAIDHQRAAISLQERLLTDRLGRLTDALLDGAIEKPIFEERKTDLLIKRRGLGDDLRTLDARRQALPVKVARFLDLLKAPPRLMKEASPGEYRGLILALTANRLINAKRAEISLAKPFLDFSKPCDFQNCCPYRDQVRTSDQEDHSESGTGTNNRTLSLVCCDRCTADYVKAVVEWAKTDLTDYTWLHDRRPEPAELGRKTYAFQRKTA